MSRFITLRKEVHAKVKQLAFEMKQTIPTTIAILVDDGLRHVEEYHPKVKEN